MKRAAHVAAAGPTTTNSGTGEAGSEEGTEVMQEAGSEEGTRVMKEAGSELTTDCHPSPHLIITHHLSSPFIATDCH